MSANPNPKVFTVIAHAAAGQMDVFFDLDARQRALVLLRGRELLGRRRWWHKPLTGDELVATFRALDPVGRALLAVYALKLKCRPPHPTDLICETQEH